MEKPNIVRMSDLVVNTELLEIQQGSFVEVTALTLKQITGLFVEFQDSLIALYAESQKKDPQYGSIVLTAPDMVSKIIAYSTGAEGHEQKVSRLPITVQLIALAMIWRLSVPDPKKLVEALSALMSELQTLNPKAEAKVLAKETETSLTST